MIPMRSGAKWCPSGKCGKSLVGRSGVEGYECVKCYGVFSRKALEEFWAR